MAKSKNSKKKSRPLLWRSQTSSKQYTTAVAIVILCGVIGIATILLTRAVSSVIPPQYLGLDSYLHLDKLSYLEIGDRINGQSTASSGGSNRDNTNTLGIINGHKILFNQTGPGIVTFMRMQENYGEPWYMTTDNIQNIFNGTDLGQTNPAAKPASLFPYPLSINRGQSHGSSIVDTAVPFVNGLRFTSGGANGNFYSIYHKLPYGSSVPTLGDSAKSKQVAALLKSAGTDIAPTGIPSQHGTLTLGAANTPTTVTTITGKNQIRALKLQVPFSEKVRLGNSTLQIYWDGETTPSVNAPIKFLASDGAGVYQPANRQLVQGLLANTTSDGKTHFSFNLYYPMPFTSSARIVIVPNGSSANLPSLDWSVRYESFADPANWWGSFHANFTTIPTPTPGEDMTFLDYSGTGKLVGTVINFDAVGGTLEGNPHIYVDDNKSPQIAGTGTEEWGLGGNYWNGGNQVSLPLGGLPSSTNNPAGTDIAGAAEYRFLIADSIGFNNHLIVNFQHGARNDSTHPYSASMMWYGTPRKTATLTDEVKIATAPTTNHAYSTSSSQNYTLTAAYEQLVKSPLISNVVAKTTGSTSFNMAVDPSNAGAFLRRSFDSCSPNQRANVYVDGKFAGTWLNAGASTKIGFDGHDRCWRDDEFPLPASMTSGKTMVNIKMTHVATVAPFSNSYWTASDYKMYSFLP